MTVGRSKEEEEAHNKIQQFRIKYLKVSRKMVWKP